MKNKLREEMKEMRRSMTSKEVTEKSGLAQRIFLQSEQYKNAKSVMLYMPLGNEVSTFEIISDAQKQGKDVLVPITSAENFEISAYKITEDTEFERGTFSVKEPREKVKFDESKIDVVLVPGIVFDRFGGRIGFGKGCYDKFLERISTIKVGFCYDFQLVDKVETHSRDVAMDYIITEKEFIRGKL